jgi:Rap guanine nucleotide exchange factor 2
MSHLLEDSSGDPSYVEDFLLTHRIFIESPLIVCSQLLEWYAHANTLCVLSPPMFIH